jgi:hypothetical protein
MFSRTNCFLLWDLPAGTARLSRPGPCPGVTAANGELEPSANTALLAEPNVGESPGRELVADVRGYCRWMFLCSDSQKFGGPQPTRLQTDYRTRDHAIS